VGRAARPGIGQLRVELADLEPEAHARSLAVTNEALARPRHRPLVLADRERASVRARRGRAVFVPHVGRRAPLAVVAPREEARLEELLPEAERLHEHAARWNVDAAVV